MNNNCYRYFNIIAVLMDRVVKEMKMATGDEAGVKQIHELIQYGNMLTVY